MPWTELLIYLRRNLERRIKISLFLKNISEILVQLNEELFALNTSQIVLFQFDDVVPF